MNRAACQNGKSRGEERGRPLILFSGERIWGGKHRKVVQKILFTGKEVSGWGGEVDLVESQEGRGDKRKSPLPSGTRIKRRKHCCLSITKKKKKGVRREGGRCLLSFRKREGGGARCAPKGPAVVTRKEGGKKSLVLFQLRQEGLRGRAKRTQERKRRRSRVPGKREGDAL